MGVPRWFQQWVANENASNWFLKCSRNHSYWVTVGASIMLAKEENDG